MIELFQWIFEGPFLIMAVVFVCALAIFISSLRPLWTQSRKLERRAKPWLSFLGSVAVLVISVGVLLIIGRNVMMAAPALLQLRELHDQPAPALRYSNVDGDTLASLADHRGQVVLVNLWATWCPPCRKEMPDLERLQQTYGDQGLVVLQISNESRDKIARYLEKQPMTTTHGYVDQFLWPAFALPTTYIVDRQGLVRWSMVGGRKYKHFERAVTKHL